MERSQRSRERDRVEQVEDGEIEEFSDKFCNRPHDSAVPRRSASSYSQRKNWDRDRDSRDHKPVDGYGKHTRVEKLQALTNRLAFRFVDNEYTLPTPSSSDGPGGKSFQISLNGPNKPVDSGRFDAQEPSSKNQQVGAGTFGVVFQSKCMLGPMAESKLGRKVAVKKIPLRHFGLEGLTLSTLREITLLEGMNHPNVISLVDVIADKYCAARYARAEKSHVYLVFPFMDHDLAGLIRSEIVPPFSSQQIKYYMKCITEGLSYLHNTRKIIHRDL